MKEMCVVFFIYSKDNKIFLLMGKQAPGKRLAGVRNGYGGKCESGENTLDCAVRELYEESGIKIEKEKFVKMGKIVEGNSTIDFFTIFSKEKFSPPIDNDEFVDVRWFDLSKREEYIHEMFPGNEPLLVSLEKQIKEYLEEGKIGNEFLLDQTDNITKEREELNRKIYK